MIRQHKCKFKESYTATGISFHTLKKYLVDTRYRDDKEMEGYTMIISIQSVKNLIAIVEKEDKRDLRQYAISGLNPSEDGKKWQSKRSQSVIGINLNDVNIDDDDDDNSYDNKEYQKRLKNYTRTRRATASASMHAKSTVVLK